MPRYAANVTMLWPELDRPADRFRAAAGAGFTAVERLFAHDLDAAAVRGLLDELGLRLVLFDAHPGARRTGGLGLLCVPGQEAKLVESVRVAVEHAHTLGTGLVNVLAGVVADQDDPAAAGGRALRNLEKVLGTVDLGGVTLVLEALNHRDMPGYLLDNVDAAAALVRAVDDPRVRLQFDAYHVARDGEDPVRAFDRVGDLAAHVQVADAPGRHQPGTGKTDLGRFLKRLDEVGYRGYVGLEYSPDGPTDEALSWLPVAERGQTR